MSAGYTSKAIDIATPVVAGASETRTPVGKPFNVSHNDSKNIIIDVTASGLSGTVSVNLEDSQDGATWFLRKATTLTAATAIDLSIERAGDQTSVPLRPICRLTITTAGASGGTISAATRTARL